MKLRSLHIEDYKMFKNFDISFVDENDEALPIVVLAGVNGSGKTSLLEYIYKTFEYDFMELKGSIRLDTSDLGDDSLPHKFEIKGHSSKTLLSKYEPDTAIGKASLLFDSIIYFPAGIDDINNIADEYVKTFYYFLKNKDYRPSEVREHFDRYMKDFFDGFDLGFKYDNLDKDDNVWFINDMGIELEIKDLSLGEKTLLSKVLYIYFKEYKNKTILIDEPELSLHPSWQNKILTVYEKLAKQNNCQIIIATHSPHIIGSAKNEYLRILRKKEDGSIEVINDLKAHGRDINSILFDVMGEVAYRPREFKDKIDKLYEDIDNRKFEEAKEKLAELKKDYGEKDSVVQEAEMLIDVLSSEE